MKYVVKINIVMNHIDVNKIVNYLLNINTKKVNNV